MTPRRSTTLSLLLLLGLTALTGCQTPSTISEVQFIVTVPPEMPADAILRIQGEEPAFISQPLVAGPDGTFSTKLRLPREEAVRYQVKIVAPTEQRALDMAGTLAAARTFTPAQEMERVELTVERWGPASGASARQTVFLVTPSADTPANSSLWLSGNQPELGTWNGAGVKLYKAQGGRYAGLLSFAAGTALEFKVTRGGWGTVEKSSRGREVSNHTHTTGTGYERVSLTVGGWADVTPEQPADPTTTGNVQYVRDVTPKNALLKKRDLIVWLPPGYDADPSRRFPVLYMHDGQNLMDESTGFAGQEWGVDETAQRLVTSGDVQPLIIVGVYNTADRIPEYTHVEVPPTERYPQSGRADLYGQFLVEEVMPLINGRYRTLTGPEDTGLAGSSLGGLVSMYLGMKYPNTFQKLGVISPSVWWANRDIVTRVQALPAKLPLHIWEDIGTAEGTGAEDETVADAQALADALRAKGWTNADLKFEVVTGGQHNEAAWKARFGDILRFLYPGRR